MIRFLQKTSAIFLTTALSVLLLTACGTANTNTSNSNTTATPLPTAETTAEKPSTRSYKDVLGRTVEIPAAPEKIIAHFYAAELKALNVPMIGTNFMNAKLALTDEQLKGIEDIGGDGLSPNLEKTLSLKPDLILVPDFLEQDDVEALSKIAPTVAISYSADVFTRLRTLAEIVGKPETAENWIQAYEKKAAEKLALVQSRIGKGETASAFILYAADKQLYVYNKQRLGPTMYDAFGFTMPPKVSQLFSSEPDSLWKNISMETLPDYAGDWIFLVSSDDTEESKKAVEELLKSPVWKSLPAVKNGKAYVVDKRWGMNDPLTLDWLLDEMARILGK
ncbi:ABC transporter substrate-binding protein [Brevibacillus agri]|uniref:ABC transporter substrate-binding protein n=1 Tax=Brevibacillus agri TaxID=51101 RepID=UPI00046F6FE5|nr:ABC transporter substrate-binding protein [Brevibacillus agri]